MENPQAGMLFVGGVGSGGTDLMWNVLNAHEQIFLVGEIPFLPAIADRFPARVSPNTVPSVAEELQRLDSYHTLSHHHWSNFIADRKDPVDLGPPPPPVDGEVSLARIYQWLIGAPPHIRWTGNKTPTNTENIDRLSRAFPDARFLVIVRDPRDVVLSWRRRWDRDELLSADKWQRRLARGRQCLQALPADRWLVLHYEAVLEDLEGVSRRMCAFLELEFDPRMLHFHEHITKSIAGQANRGRPLVVANTGKWRSDLPPGKARRVEEITWEGMLAHGYRPELAAGPRPLARHERIRGRAQDVIAVLRGRNAHQQVNRGRDWVGRVVLQAKRLLLHRRITT